MRKASLGHSELARILDRYTRYVYTQGISLSYRKMNLVLNQPNNSTSPRQQVLFTT
ncbi:hypothetical protein [Aeromonas phage Akh-2]|nr:hypothetical protein [Aeromonas phage Akh-2]